MYCSKLIIKSSKKLCQCDRKSNLYEMKSSSEQCIDIYTFEKDNSVLNLVYYDYFWLIQ